MGIIETIKMLAEEEGLEKGLQKGIEKGLEEGIKKEKRTIVRSMILNTNFDNAKIAQLCDTAEAAVKQMREDLSSENINR
jgi:flagellar biosynthesis/type III secretory pathway protein FliH